ncbi:MAG: TPM domain-containing protein [Actinobacteria bacterium]|jgi:uncharacterized membrane protein YgcG|nr:TPM domain-containing protein [Actinomycetota bacterium]
MLGRRCRLPAILLLALVWLAAAGSAAAQDVPRLPDEVTDGAELLDGREDEVRDALAAVRDRVQLFVLTTGTTGGIPITDFADEVAASNSLGGDDALLVVAIDDRAYALWVANALPGVSDADIAAINRDVIEPRLAEGDFAGAAIDAAAALAQATADEPGPAGEPPPVPPSRTDPVPEPDDTSATGRVSRTPWVLAAVVIAFLAAAGWSRVQQRRGRRRNAEERDRRLGELARLANARLVASDEAVREAATELGFAEAQFHADDVAPLREALAQARTQLHDAFERRQRLDDDVPETPEQRQAMLQEIVALTERIDRTLAAEYARLADLRKLEERAPRLLDELAVALTAATTRRDGADELHAELVVSPTAVQATRGNLVEADKRLQAARRELDVGASALQEQDRSGAARAARGAQVELAAATELVAAVERAAAEVDEARRGIDDALVAAASAVDRAAAALPGAPTPADGPTDAPGAPAASPPAPPPPPSPASLLDEARFLLAEARSFRETDIVRGYELASSAQAAANQAEALVRAAHERRERDLAAATAALQSARAVHDRAADYLATRREGVGREARTRLQEAERHLEVAIAALEGDPASAAAHARTAEQLANEAYRLAQRDFDQYDQFRGPFGRGPFGGRGGSTIVIGGFPIPLGGSGRRGGGWGGSAWGSPGGGRSFGGGFGGGGFGGGRSGGGGFGGGRSGGGRF